jgi:hypothetical protein
LPPSQLEWQAAPSFRRIVAARPSIGLITIPTQIGPITIPTRIGLITIPTRTETTTRDIVGGIAIVMVRRGRNERLRRAKGFGARAQRVLRQRKAEEWQSAIEDVRDALTAAAF